MPNKANNPKTDIVANNIKISIAISLLKQNQSRQKIIV
ncbi:hypothetical protein SPONN_2206 [uncultured Candidatus Thioglobus sp.]|nr:hypothetical protein SPONN_2206 [uncultured Candidatus Thioglobus sp.]